MLRIRYIHAIYSRETNALLGSFLIVTTSSNMSKNLQIRNSTAEFLIFQLENKEQGISVMYTEDTLWLTQDAIAILFDKKRSTITEHLQNIFNSNELQKSTDSVLHDNDRLYASKYMLYMPTNEELKKRDRTTKGILSLAT